jgi:hypothetical protein
MSGDLKNTCIFLDCENEAMHNALYCPNHKDIGCAKLWKLAAALISEDFGDVATSSSIYELIGDVLTGDD